MSAIASRIGNVRARAALTFARVQERGVAWAAGRVAGRVVKLGLWLVLLPLAATLHLAGFRRVSIFAQRIGHLAGEADTFLKEQALGRLPKRRWFIVARPEQVANHHMLDYCRERIPTVSQPPLSTILDVMSSRFLLRYDVSDYMLNLRGTARMYEINSAWAGRSPIFGLRAKDHALAGGLLQREGVDAGDWFVCVHARDGNFSPEDEPLHSYRNGRIEALIPAMREVVARGGWCIRMGGPTSVPLPRMDRVIDYAHSSWRSPRMDVALCARARFFLGDSSGLFFISTAFGVPSALANLIPLAVLAIAPGDLCIPKLLWSTKEQRFLSFEEALSSEVGSFRYTRLYRESGIEPRENEPDDILELAREMLDRIDGRFTENEGDEFLQKRFRRLFRPGHYGHASASRVGTAFLRKHENLLP